MGSLCSSSSSGGSGKMATATWNGVVIAEASKWESVEGNVYFPPESVKWDYFTETSKTTGCPWKGTSNYYTVNVNGKENVNCAWVYKTPKAAAANIKGHIAFWNGVQVKKH